MEGLQDFLNDDASLKETVPLESIIQQEVDEVLACIKKEIESIYDIDYSYNRREVVSKYRVLRIIDKYVKGR